MTITIDTMNQTGNLSSILLLNESLESLEEAAAAAAAAAAEARAIELSRNEMIYILDIRLYVYGYVMLPLALVGLALNSFTILVLMHPKMRYFSTNAYLTTLSVSNIFCLINFLFLYSLRYLLAYELFKANLNSSSLSTDIYKEHSYENFINFIYGIAHPVVTTFQLYSIYLTCAVTVDRWIYITFPLKVDTICSMRNTFIAIISIFAFCLIYNIPRWFEIESYQVHLTNSSTIYQAQLTRIGMSPIFDQIVRRYTYMIFVYGLPFFVLIVVNIGIVKKLIETKRRKRDLLGGVGVTGAASAMAAAASASNPLLLENGSGTATTPNGMMLASNGRHYSGSFLSSAPNGESVPLANSNSHHHHLNHLARNKSTSISKKSMSMLRSSLASSIKLDPRLTLMVMAIVLAFFLCQFPYLIVNILYLKIQKDKWFHYAKIGCDLLSVINYCINFLIYCFFGQNFRELAAFMLCHPSLHPYNQTKLLRVLATKRRSKRVKGTIGGAGLTGTGGGAAVGAATSTFGCRQSSIALPNTNNILTPQLSTSRIVGDDQR